MHGGIGKTQRILLVLQGSGELGKFLRAMQGGSGKADPSGLGRAARGAQRMDASGLCEEAAGGRGRFFRALQSR